MIEKFMLIVCEDLTLSYTPVYILGKPFLWIPGHTNSRNRSIPTKNWCIPIPISQRHISSQPLPALVQISCPLKHKLHFLMTQNRNKFLPVKWHLQTRSNLHDHVLWCFSFDVLVLLDDHWFNYRSAAGRHSAIPWKAKKKSRETLWTSLMMKEFDVDR